MQQLLCDGSTCGLLIQDGTERVDVALIPRRDPVSHLTVAGGRYNFHTACYQQAGALLPSPGLSVTVTRVAAATVPTTPTDPETAAAALPEPMRAPAA